ncbi:cytochrome P450 monooxygenase-like protein [Cadophora sp. MPI-SDFR-AT-0126]|nr:cytochrome P450 monooxygenase-like protein [Leotiomycetes sp. MPI-SDFR-AT-0126]
MGLLDGIPTAGYSLWFIVLCLLVFLGLASLINNVIYNLYQHPLHEIPGPKIAGATYLYQTYYSLRGTSTYYKRIREMHAQYGPVIRITPDEVHLSDTDNYETINCVGTKYAKSTQFYDGFTIGYSTFSCGPIDIHRIRRGLLEPFFSRRNVMNLEYIVQERAQKLSKIIRDKFAKNEAVDLHHTFRSISVDVITEYAFGACYNLMDKEDLGAEFFAMVSGIGPCMWVFQQWPLLAKIVVALPPDLVKHINGPLKQMMNLREHCRVQVRAVKANMESGKKLDKPSIFPALLAPPEGIPAPSVEEIKDEALSILAAAADTTGNAMTVAAYNVVNNPEIYKQLREELVAAFPNAEDELDYATLEKLPYLTGVVKEGLRLSFGVPGRLARIVPAGGATFNGHFIAGGSFVSMSSWMQHQDETYYPNALKFDPTRWLDPAEARRIDKAFVSFGKGSRGCVGINLAYCELYVSLGTLFRRYDNLLSNHLTAEDWEYDDYFSGYSRPGAAKFHVTAAPATIGSEK